MCQGSGEDPDADSFAVTKVYYNRGAGKRQVKSRQRSVVQSRVRKVQNGRQGQGRRVSNPGWYNKVQNDMQAQGQGKQNGQKPGKLENRN